MAFPMPSWVTIIASTTSDIAALFAYVLPISNWIVVAIIAIGVPTLIVGLLLKLVHGHGK